MEPASEADVKHVHDLDGQRRRGIGGFQTEAAAGWPVARPLPVGVPSCPESPGTALARVTMLHDIVLAVDGEGAPG